LVKHVQGTLPEGVTVTSTRDATESLDKAMRANQLAFTLGTMMAFLAASFIIMTGMSTGITERVRELAMLRCIGATRAHLAQSQLLMGLLVGVTGAVVGLPAGVGAAWVILHFYREKLHSDPVILPDRVTWAFLGAVLAGVAGALVPAWQASRVSPLSALVARARPPRARGL